MIYHGARAHKGGRNSRGRKKLRIIRDAPLNIKTYAAIRKMRRGRCAGTVTFTGHFPCFRVAGEGTRSAWEKRADVCQPCRLAKIQKSRSEMMELRTARHAAEQIIIKTAGELIARGERYIYKYWHNTRLQWSNQDQADLKVLVMAGADLEKSADALRRSPTSLAWRARDMRLSLPPKWAALIAPKRVLKPRLPRFILKYPDLAKARPSDEDLLRVNALVPHGYPDWQRADICQSVMLAFYEGKVSIAELEANKDDLRWFYKKYYREQAPYQEILESSLQSVDDDRSFEEIAAKRANFEAQGERWIMPSQIDDVYQAEIGVAKFVYRANHLTSAEAAEKLEAGEVRVRDLDMNIYRRGTFGVRLHAQDRLFERFGVELTKERADAILRFCRGRPPDRSDTGAEIHIFKSSRGEIPFVYDRAAHEVITVLPSIAVTDKG